MSHLLKLQSVLLDLSQRYRDFFCFVFVFIIIFVFEHAANMDSKAVDVSCFIQMISVLSNNHLLL